MATPDELIDAVKLTLEGDSNVPDGITYLTQRADLSGGDAGVKLPVVEIQVVSSIDLNEHNTDKVSVKTEQSDIDGDGSMETVETGRVYHSEYELDLQIDVWVAGGSSHDVDDIGNSVRKSLYLHDSSGPSEPFTVDIDGDGNIETIDSIWRFKILDGQREDDLRTSPSVRRWRQDIAMWSYEEFDTTEEYIVDVHYPESMTETDGIVSG